MSIPVAVLGAGVMGTALALAFERAGCAVTICGTEFDEAIIGSIERDGTHPALRVGVPPEIGLVRAGQWDKPLSTASIVTVAVVSSGLRDVVATAAPSIPAGAIWAIGSKGWDSKTGSPLSEVVRDASPSHPVVIVVGPSLATELASGTPTAMVCASNDLGAAEKVAGALSSGSLKAFVTDDVAGVEVGAALKNVLAIAIGICDGLAQVKGIPMTNTKAAIFSRGLAEMAKLAEVMGGRPTTILGLAGAGDLFVTVLGGRNGKFGRLIGSGLAPQQALSEMGTTVEGFENTRLAVDLAKKWNLHLPVVRMVEMVLYESVAPEVAISDLTSSGVEVEL